MKEYAESFYKSQRWQRTREAYLRSRGGLCERCLKKGIYTPAVIVHHKVYIDTKTINNPEITLASANLEALCKSCHEREHRRSAKRYRVDEFGRVTVPPGCD